MYILGIDPGSTLIGYGLIKKTSKNELEEITHGVLKITEKDLSQKIASLAKRLRALIKKTKPDLVGVEKLFFAKNKKTALEVAHARGVIMLIVLESRLPVVEYPPAEIKQAVTGYGSADKKMIQKMVSIILKTELHSDDNAADALAVAITTANRYEYEQRTR